MSFASDEPDAYIAMDPVNVDQDFETTMKIKTLERDGLVFYVADDTQVSAGGFDTLTCTVHAFSLTTFAHQKS